MADALNSLDMRGRIVIGEDDRLAGDDLLRSGQTVGSGRGPEVDVVVDPIDGTNLLIKGHSGAISVVGVAPRGSMWSPVPAVYMEKIIVGHEAAAMLVPECLDAPAAWTLALVARARKKSVQDMTVVVLNRARHTDLIEEIRASGARIMLRDEGDVEGALLAVASGSGIDLLMGIGGASQGVIAACAVKAMGGAMLARLAPQSESESAAIKAAGLDAKRILRCHELVAGEEIFFAATGITNSVLLNRMKFHGTHAETHSLLIRSETGTKRFIFAEHAARA
jgi:fructose-1,6-bisphosphatase II